jgi:hypothetical protein
MYIKRKGVAARHAVPEKDVSCLSTMPVNIKIQYKTLKNIVTAINPQILAD